MVKTWEKLVVEELTSKWPNIQAIYVFGSVATGEDRPGSDLDLAVLGSPNPTLAWQLAIELGTLLVHDVDLVDLRSVNHLLQAEVVQKGKLLWCHDPLEVEDWELSVWSSYQNMVEQTKYIVEEGIASGRYYNP